VSALRQIRRSLVPGGIVVDTQPLSPHPPVEAGDRALGTLDMSEWAQTIATIDRLVEQTLADGLFELEHERRYVVTDVYGDGAELVAVTRGWAGTHVDDAFAERVGREPGHVRLHQDVRLRVLRTR
jgi:hypothetical protein